MTCKTDMLRKIQQLNFVMTDVGLYLNTHPACPKGKALFRKVQKMHHDAKKEYEDVYGPLTYEGINTSKDGWSWINKPWPWEGEE